jgi:hypothetical protein
MEELFNYFIQELDDAIDNTDEYPDVIIDTYPTVITDEWSLYIQDVIINTYPTVITDEWSLYIHLPYQKRILNNLHSYVFDCGGYETWKNMLVNNNSFDGDDDITVEARCKVIEIVANVGYVEVVLQWMKLDD